MLQEIKYIVKISFIITATDILLCFFKFYLNGYMKIKIEDFREGLDIPNSYRTCSNNQSVLRCYEKLSFTSK